MKFVLFQCKKWAFMTVTEQDIKQFIENNWIDSSIENSNSTNKLQYKYSFYLGRLIFRVIKKNQVLIETWDLGTASLIYNNINNENSKNQD